jgi:hypothetical protein
MSWKNEINPIETIDDISVLNEKYGIKSMVVNGELLNTNGEPFGDLPEDFETKKQELIDAYNANIYQKKRSQQYPKITDQLDMLWHEINNNGSLSTDGEWFNRIKSVKEDNPKN